MLLSRESSLKVILQCYNLSVLVVSWPWLAEKVPEQVVFEDFQRLITGLHPEILALAVLIHTEVELGAVNRGSIHYIRLQPEVCKSMGSRPLFLRYKYSCFKVGVYSWYLRLLIYVDLENAIYNNIFKGGLLPMISGVKESSTSSCGGHGEITRASSPVRMNGGSDPAYSPQRNRLVHHHQFRQDGRAV